MKRKLEEEPVQKPSVKNLKLDISVSRKETKDNTHHLELISPRTTTVTETSSSFQNTTRASGRISRSLFAGVKDRVIPNSSIPFEKSSAERSLILDSLKRPVDETTSERPSRRSSKSLFTKSNTEYPQMGSPSLFSSCAEDNTMVDQH